MPNVSHRIRPTITHQIAGRSLRQFTVDGQPWYPIHDLIPLLGTTRNATQIARSLPTWTTRRLQVTMRPATHMINGAGVRELIRKAPETRDKDHPLNQLERWANKHLKKPTITPSQKLVAEMRALQGDISVMKTKLDERNAAMEALLMRMESTTEQENESP